MFQEFIPKKADIRSTVIRGEIFSALIKSQDYKESIVDFRKKLDIPMEKYFLPEEVKLKLLRFLEILNLEFAACDFALTEDNELVFFEANVSGNWLWIEDALTFPISETIAKILIKKND
jgi:glutathione synthase/RimK-type ligase-like ATP-grasp enzyme